PRRARCAAARSPTARSSRRRRRSAASTSSRPTTSTPRSRSPSTCRTSSGASRCVRCRCSTPDARSLRMTGVAAPAAVDGEIADDRLRLICTCCHPALAADAKVALTLRLLCGLSTAEVARAFLVSEPTMAARITRAKKKIAGARIPYRVPSAEELPARIEAVLTVVHLLFTTGHTAPAGDDLVRRDLVERSLDLA